MVIKEAREVLKIEAQAILNLVDRIGEEFERAVGIILGTKGRVILTGIGKSGLVGRKISATLNSTGTASLFLHPTEAIHGDLGMVTKEDIILAISNSGQTPELSRIFPILKDMGVKIILFTGSLESPMAQVSDVVIDVGVEREACPMGLAPTASTTAALAMGDALAVALIGRRRFNPKDFRRFHPGGNLGQRLSVTVKEVMRTGDHIPRVLLGSRVGKALQAINSKGLGATLVTDKAGKLKGIVTDGDLRRALVRQGEIRGLKVEEIMGGSPQSIDEECTVLEALSMMEFNAITHLPIVDPQNRVIGLVHLHDLLGREAFGINGRRDLTPRTHR